MFVVSRKEMSFSETEKASTCKIVVSKAIGVAIRCDSEVIVHTWFDFIEKTRYQTSSWSTLLVFVVANVVPTLG
jgi:hypothetical protein